MSTPQVDGRLRSLWHWLGDHALTFVNVFLVVALLAAATLLGSGLFFTPSTTTVAPPRTVTHRHATPVPPTPAETVLASLLTSNLPGYAVEGARPSESHSTICSPSAATPYTSTTSTTSTTLSTSAPTGPPTTLEQSATIASATLDVAETVRVYGAGLGGEALADDQAAATCSTSRVTAIPALDGYQATSSSYSAPSVETEEFREGDVIVTLSVFPVGYEYIEPTLLALAITLDTTLKTILSPVCVNMNAAASAATRNPTMASYTPYATTITLRPPSSITPPDLSLVDGSLPSVTVSAGSVTSPPVAPVVPTVALTTSVADQVADPTGPGCGWAFTGMVAPPFVGASSPLSALEQAALEQLETSWTQWPSVAAQYRRNLALYDARLAAYTSSTTTTTTPTSTTTTTRPVLATTTSTAVPTSTTTTSAPST